VSTLTPASNMAQLRVAAEKHRLGIVPEPVMVDPVKVEPKPLPDWLIEYRAAADALHQTYVRPLFDGERRRCSAVRFARTSRRYGQR
jgi:hypothetical protein